VRFSRVTARRSRRGLLALAPVLVCLLAAFRPAPASIQARLETYLADWYATIPGTRIAVSPTREVTVPGFSAWRLERKAEGGGPAAARTESGLALADEARGEVFLGEVLHDPDRLAAKKPFDPEADLRNIQSSLQDMLGVPVKLELAAPASGHARANLRPIVVRALQGEDAWTALPGFVSTDGATVLLGELRPLSEPIVSWRTKLLASRPGVRAEPGAFAVTEFLDFQCERCKRRTPEARRAAAALGGTVEVRFLPLVKQHEWSFAAAECAAALAEAAPAAFLRYEEAVFGRFESMSAAAARELAGDMAEASKAKAAYEAALSSGRARDRVLRDIELASRLGIHGTPSFVLDWKLVPGERGYLENALMQVYGPGRRKESGDRVIR
jgi:hypothetical protein